MSEDFALVADPGRPDCLVLYIGGLASSHVDLRDPQRLWMDYQARLAVALDALRPTRGAAVDVLHLGGRSAGAAPVRRRHAARGAAGGVGGR